MESRQPHEALRQIMARPKMFVGDTENLLEAVWIFLSGFECGYCYRNESEDGPLFPRELVRHIQAELGLQWNDTGVVPAILKLDSRPDAAFEILRELVGKYYGCSLDLKAWQDWKAESSDQQNNPVVPRGAI